MVQGQMRPPCLILIFLITIITILIIIIIIILLILILILTIILIILIIIILILILILTIILIIILILILILIFLITIISLGSLSRRVAGLSPGNASVTGCRDGERAERGERCDSGALALALLGELSAFLRQRYIEIMGTLTDDGSKNVLP